jgi:hypothetical protein
MNDEWAVLSRLLDSALDLPPDARAAWIESLGPEHDAFKPRLRRMLEVPAIGNPGLRLPRFGDSGADAVGDEGDTPSERGSVGPYRLIRRIAQGGMGTVWRSQPLARPHLQRTEPDWRRGHRPGPRASRPAAHRFSIAGTTHTRSLSGRETRPTRDRRAIRWGTHMDQT